MSFGYQEPIEAIVLPEENEPLFSADENRPPKKKRSVLLIGCAIVVSFFVLFVAAFAFWVGRIVQESNRTAARWLTPTQRQAALVAAFDDKREKLEDADLIEVEQLLQRIATTSRERDDAGFCALVDVEMLVKRIADYPGQTAINAIERSLLKHQLQQDMDGVGDVDRFRIAALDHPDPDHVVVFAEALNSEILGDPFRFILCRTDEGLKVEDWERVETGWTQASQYARAYIAEDDWRLNNYAKFWDELVEIENLIASYEYEEAEPRLKTVERLSLPPELADVCHSRVALNWLELGDYEECLKANRRVQKPDEMPGVYAAAAVAHWSLEQYDQAIAAADNYERVAGFQVEVVDTKAQILTDMGRREEAAIQWRRLAEFSPDDANILASYCETLPQSDREQIVELVERSQTPLETALALADHLIYQDDEATLAALLPLARKQPTDLHASQRLLAKIYGYQGHYDLAAAHYLAAAKLAGLPDDANRDWYQYLDAMVEEGRMVEGYQALPDASTALRHLADGIDDYGGLIDYDELAVMLELHRERAPQDPWRHYFAGLLANHRGEWEKAEQELAEAIASNDEDVGYQARARYQSVLMAMGKPKEAYYVAPEMVYDLVSECELDGNVEAMDLLLKLHRENEPDDWWLQYYATRLERLEGRLESALENANKLLDSADEDNIEYATELRNQLLVETDAWYEQYVDSSTPEEAFDSFITRLLELNNGKAVATLCTFHLSRCPEDPNGLVQCVAFASALGNDSTVMKSLSPWPRGLLESSYAAGALRQQLIRALLNLDLVDRAREQAEEFAEVDEDLIPLFIVLDHQRDWTRFAELLEKPEAREVLAGQLEYGETNSLLAYRSEAGASALRREHPTPLPMDDFYGSVTILRSKPSALNYERLLALFAYEKGFRIRTLPVGKPETEQAWELQFPAGRIVVATGSGLYCDRSLTPEFQQREPLLAEILLGHDGWIVIQAVEAKRPDCLFMEKMAFDLAAELIDEDSQAVEVTESGYVSSRMALVDESTTDALRSGDAIEERFPGSIIYRQFAKTHVSDPQPPFLADGSRRKQFREFCQAIDTSDTSENPQIAVRLNMGPASEVLWLEVVEAKHVGYGRYDFTGQVIEASQIWPWLKPGEHVSCDWYDVIDWRSAPNG